MNEELKYLLVLQRALLLNPSAQHRVLDAAGTAKTVFENRKDIREVCASIHPRTAKSIAAMEDYLPRVESELEFIEKNNIQVFAYGDKAYPQRLRNLADAPTVLFCMGNANLSAKHVLSVVGSRQCTVYGKTFCQRFLSELQQICPDVLVVSGLAYGIDIAAHRAALSCGLPTLGVLAHGLDQIYPRIHRSTANEMLTQGGLITEFQSGATAEKANFVSRNRIVAALSEATIVVESKTHGGSMITVGLANGLGRRVFAVPGRLSDELSSGCNALIQESKAEIICSAAQFAEAMGWRKKEQQTVPVQLDLFPELGADQRKLLDLLRQSDQGMTPNEVVALTSMSVAHVTAVLFELELMGVTKMLGGNRYVVL